MDKQEFYEDVYESLSSDKGGFELDNACFNRIVCLLEDIAVSLRALVRVQEYQNGSQT